jgi:hypothetical protein
MLQPGDTAPNFEPTTIDVRALGLSDLLHGGRSVHLVLNSRNPPDRPSVREILGALCHLATATT